MRTTNFEQQQKKLLIETMKEQTLDLHKIHLNLFAIQNQLIK